MEIYHKAFDIIEHFFGSEEEDARVAPTVDPQGQQFTFAAPSSAPASATDHTVPGGGHFQF